MNLQYLRACARAAGDKDRPNLTVVQVEIQATQTFYTATNGHILCHLREEIPSDKARFLHFPAKDLLKLRGTTELTGDRLTAGNAFVDNDASFLDGSALFPDYRRVIPKEFNDKPIPFGFEVMAAFCAIAKELDLISTGYQLRYNGEAPAMAVIPQGIVVLLPFRQLDFNLPEWLQ